MFESPWQEKFPACYTMADDRSDRRGGDFSGEKGLRGPLVRYLR